MRAIRALNRLHWSQVFMFGWMLAFPFSGPVLQEISIEGFSNSLFALIFMGCHGLSLLCTGLFAQEKYWQRLMQAGVSLCLAGTLLLALTKLAWFPLFIAGMMGVSSGWYVIGWTYPYSFGTRPQERLKIMALIILASNILVSLLNALLQVSSTWPSLLTSSLFLVVALAFCVGREEEWGKGVTAPASLPRLTLALTILYVLIIYVNGGLLYGLVYPSVSHIMAFRYLRLLTYMVILVTIAALPRVRVTSLVYMGASLMGITFVLWAGFGDMVAGQVAVPLVLEGSFAFIDLFTWTAPAVFVLLVGRSFKVFGLVLSANVAAIFIGYLVGDYVSGQSHHQITMGLFACALIFLAILILPWLKEVDQEAQDKPDFQIIPNYLNLTPREREIFGLLLQGHSNKDIAGMLFVSANTLKTHIKSIYGKLGISHKRELHALMQKIKIDK